MGKLQLFANLIYIIVLFLSPVLLPPGQAAIALTHALSGQFGLRFWGMTALLTTWLSLALVYTTRRLDWRHN